MVRCASSLLVLLAEVDALNPKRDRTSDGGLGDAAHAARRSSHNPDVHGVYRARDFDRDGINADAFADHIRKRGQAGDPRLRNGGYVIWNRRIAGPDGRGWQWRPYSGLNDHTHHVHVSVTDDPAHYDDERPWGWFPLPTPAVPVEDDMLFLVSADGIHYLTNGIVKRPVHSSAEEKAFKAAGVKPLTLTKADVLAIPDQPR